MPVALGDTLALVPVAGVDVRINGSENPISRLAAPAPYRAALNDLAVAWWANRLPSASTPTIVTAHPALNPLPPDLPDGYVGLTESGGYTDAPGTLPEYTSAAVAGQRFGAAYYRREMALRRTVAALGRDDGLNSQRLNDAVYLGQGPLARKIRAVGLMRRLDSAGLAGDVSPALDDLRRTIGAERLRHALITLSTAGATPNDAPSVACALYHLTGEPVTAWMNRYLTRYAAIKPARGCR